MGQDPQELTHDTEALRRDIARTREGMDATLDQIEDRVSPSRMVERRKARVRSALGGAKERVMGTAQQLRDDGQAQAEHAGGRLSHAGEAVGERVDQLEEEGKRRYEGNPLAAGLIAFGAGALLGSLLPKSEQEQQMAGELQDRLQPAVDELRAAGESVAEDVKHEAQERVEHVKATANEAVETVKDDARTASEHVREETQDRAQRVQDEAQR